MESWNYHYSAKKTCLPDETEVAYIEAGKGDVSLLFIHGLGSNLQAWNKTIDGLKNQFHCLALDLPGYGKSSKGQHLYDMSFFASAVLSFLDKLRLEKVVLIGHSMGGQIAISTALQNDSRIKKLVLIAPAGLEIFSEIEKEWFDKNFTQEIIKALTEEQIVSNFKINFHHMPDDAQFMIADRMAMRKSIEYDHFCRMIPKCIKGMLNEPIFHRLKEIKIPVLLFFGENDKMIPNPFLHPKLTPETVAKTGSEQIADCSLYMVPDAGHFLQWEKPVEVNKAIQIFCQ